jgi:serine/threonine protein kinase
VLRCDLTILLVFLKTHRPHQNSETHNCPCFIIALAGPWLCILGAVFVVRPIIQPLTDYMWLGEDVHRPIDGNLRRVVHTLSALDTGLKTLADEYHHWQPSPSPWLHLFPFSTSYKINNATIKFRYLDHLAPVESARAVFKAEMSTGQLIVVKFTQRYNHAAHRLLASHGLAPQLLYYPEMSPNQSEGIFGGLQMIVMEYVDGKTAHGVPNELSIAFKDVEKAMKVLHDAGLVFGDLRTPNIMIKKDTGRGLLIDFDWCAKVGQGRYPKTINVKSVRWHPYVQGGGVMKQEHDLHMLELLRPELR